MYLTPPEKRIKHFWIWQDQVISFLFHIHENTTSNFSALPGHSWLSPDPLPPTTLYPPIKCPEWDAKAAWPPVSRNPSYPPDDQAMFSQPDLQPSLREQCCLFLLHNYQCHRPRCEQTRTSTRWGYPNLSILFLKVFMVFVFTILK